MVERLIRQCKVRIEVLNAIVENENLTTKEALDIREKLETEHFLLDELTGNKGDGKPE